MYFKRIEPDNAVLKKIAALYRACFNAPDKGENWTTETARQYFQDRIEENAVFAVLEDDNHNLAGVCCGSAYQDSFIARELAQDFKDCFYISLVALSADYQGKGLGKTMLREYCALIDGMGFQSIMVRCRADNEPMRRLLSRQNFKEIRRHTTPQGGVTCERVIFMKNTKGI